MTQRAATTPRQLAWLAPVQPGNHLESSETRLLFDPEDWKLVRRTVTADKSLFSKWRRKDDGIGVAGTTGLEGQDKAALLGTLKLC